MKQWISSGYIHDEDDPPRCSFCDKEAEEDDEIAETPFSGVYCCDNSSCTMELGEMCKESYFKLESDDDDNE